MIEDLDWNQFSPHLADGIVVSILDSFGTELPALDQAEVQGVLEEIERESPQPTVHGKQMSGKEEYFKEIAEPEKQSANISPELSLDEITTRQVSLLLNQQTFSIGKQDNVEPPLAAKCLLTDNNTEPAYYVTDRSVRPALLTTLDMRTWNSFQPLQHTGKTDLLCTEGTVTPTCQLIMDEPAFQTNTSNQAIGISSPCTLGVDEFDWVLPPGSKCKESIYGPSPQTDFFATTSNKDHAPFRGEAFLNGSNAHLNQHVSVGKHDMVECFW